ncbi:MAG TPA: hypothetical protein VFG52_10650, partial [Xanthomonadales bacterium]|nr:hypothetical protein [Xanthomonadales bacterium]
MILTSMASEVKSAMLRAFCLVQTHGLSELDLPHRFFHTLAYGNTHNTPCIVSSESPPPCCAMDSRKQRFADWRNIMAGLMLLILLAVSLGCAFYGAKLIVWTVAIA